MKTLGFVALVCFEIFLLALGLTGFSLVSEYSSAFLFSLGFLIVVAMAVTMFLSTAALFDRLFLKEQNSQPKKEDSTCSR